MSRPVIFFDFDGTLVDDRGRIHPADVALLAEDGRALYVPATGRSLPSVKRTFEQNGLFAGRPIPLPLVLQNGAALYGPGERLLRYRPWPKDVQDAVVAAAQAHPRVTSYLFAVETLYGLWRAPYALALERRFDLDPVPFESAAPDEAFSKLMCISGDAGELAAVAERLAALPLERAYSLPDVLEVNQAGINKGDGALALLAEIGMAGSAFVAAGDGENDLGLFEAAALTFAPSTGLPGIQECAHHVIDVSREGLLTPILRVLADSRRPS